MNFSNRTKINGTTKNFIIAFAVFVLILGVGSAVLFMYSLDFDLSNLVETTTEANETTTEPVSEVYSVNSLTGKSNIMFVVLNDKNNVEFVCCSLIDFDNKSFKVQQLAGDTQVGFGKTYKSVNGVYKESGEVGLKSLLKDHYKIEIDKYAVFKRSDLKKFLTTFGGITVNVPENINYTSSDFDIELDKGTQSLSAEKTINYLFACDGIQREKALCDVFTSILTKENVVKADSLFKKFVNACETDISVIDFSNSVKTLEIYCSADDKFMPVSYSDGE